MNRYEYRVHIGCGGNLSFEKTERQNIVVNQKAVNKYNAKAIIKPVTKNFFRCDKCNDLVNIITCPSWEEFVLMGKIRVSKQQYWEIKNRTKQIRSN